MNQGNDQIIELSDTMYESCPATADSEAWRAIVDHLSEIVSIERQMEELKKRRLQLKADAPSLLSRLYDHATRENEDAKYVASILYWRGKGLLNAIHVGSPLGLHPSSGNAFYPLIVGKCESCNGEITKSSHSNTPYYHKKLCRDCQNLESEHKAQEHRQEEVLRTERLHQLRTMPYKEYLQTDEWKEKRLLAMKRSNFRCQVCNGKGQLNTHHRTYERRGNEQMKDLIVLCEPCHGIFHRQGKLAKEQA